MSLLPWSFRSIYCDSEASRLAGLRNFGFLSGACSVRAWYKASERLECVVRRTREILRINCQVLGRWTSERVERVVGLLSR